MNELTPLDPAGAERFLAEVEWAKRFMATVNGSRGFNQIPVYSMEELLRVARGGAVVISSEAVVEWVGETLGDVAVAEAVRQTCVDIPLFSQAAAVLPLLSARYDEALAATGRGSCPA